MTDLYDDDGEWWTEYDDDLYADEYEALEQDDGEWDEDYEPLNFVKQRIVLTCDGLYVVRMYLRMYPNDTYQSVFSRYPLFYGCAPKMTDEIPF